MSIINEYNERNDLKPKLDVPNIKVAKLPELEAAPIPPEFVTKTQELVQELQPPAPELQSETQPQLLETSQLGGISQLEDNTTTPGEPLTEPSEKQVDTQQQESLQQSLPLFIPTGDDIAPSGFDEVDAYDQFESWGEVANQGLNKQRDELLRQGSFLEQSIDDFDLTRTHLPTIYTGADDTEDIIRNSNSWSEWRSKYGSQIAAQQAINNLYGDLKPLPQDRNDPNQFRPDSTRPSGGDFLRWLGDAFSWSLSDSGKFDIGKMQFGEAGNGSLGALLYALSLPQNAVIGALADIENFKERNFAALPKPLRDLLAFNPIDEISKLISGKDLIAPDPNYKGSYTLDALTGRQYSFSDYASEDKPIGFRRGDRPKEVQGKWKTDPNFWAGLFLDVFSDPMDVIWDIAGKKVFRGLSKITPEVAQQAQKIPNPKELPPSSTSNVPRIKPGSTGTKLPQLPSAPGSVGSKLPPTPGSTGKKLPQLQPSSGSIGAKLPPSPDSVGTKLPPLSGSISLKLPQLPPSKYYIPDPWEGSLTKLDNIIDINNYRVIDELLLPPAKNEATLKIDVDAQSIAKKKQESYKIQDPWEGEIPAKKISVDDDLVGNATDNVVNALPGGTKTISALPPSQNRVVENLESFFKFKDINELLYSTDRKLRYSVDDPWRSSIDTPKQLERVVEVTKPKEVLRIGGISIPRALPPAKSIIYDIENTIPKRVPTNLSEEFKLTFEAFRQAIKVDITPSPILKPVRDSDSLAKKLINLEAKSGALQSLDKLGTLVTTPKELAKQKRAQAKRFKKPELEQEAQALELKPRSNIPQVDKRVFEGELTISEIAKIINDGIPGSQVDDAALRKKTHTLDQILELMRIIPAPDGKPLVSSTLKRIKTWDEVKRRLRSRGAEDPVYQRLFAREGAPIPIEALKSPTFRVVLEKPKPFVAQAEVIVENSTRTIDGTVIDRSKLQKLDTSVKTSYLPGFEPKPKPYIEQQDYRKTLLAQKKALEKKLDSIQDYDQIDDLLRQIEEIDDQLRHPNPRIPEHKAVLDAEVLPSTQTGTSPEIIEAIQRKLDANEELMDVSSHIKEVSAEVQRLEEILQQALNKIDETVDLGRRDIIEDIPVSVKKPSKEVEINNSGYVQEKIKDLYRTKREDVRNIIAKQITNLEKARLEKLTDAFIKSKTTGERIHINRYSRTFKKYNIDAESFIKKVDEEFFDIHKEYLDQVIIEEGFELSSIKQNFFHGTRVSNLEPGFDPIAGGKRAEWGQGFYITQDVDHATNAAKASIAPNIPQIEGREFAQPRVLEIETNLTKVLDVNSLAPTDVENVFVEALREVDKLAGRMMKRNIQTKKRTLRSLYALTEKILARFYEGADIAEDTLSGVQRNINNRLRDLGYEAITDGTTMNVLDTSKIRIINSELIEEVDAIGTTTAQYNVDSFVAYRNPDIPSANTNQAESAIRLTSQVLEEQKKKLAQLEQQQTAVIDKLLKIDEELEALAKDDALKSQIAKEMEIEQQKRKTNNTLNKPSDDPCNF